MKMELQSMTMNIFSVCVQKGKIIDMQWIQRQENVKIDNISNIIDYEDLGVTNEFFQFTNKKWDLYKIDRFASSQNKKLKRFIPCFGIQDQKVLIVFAKIGATRIMAYSIYCFDY